MTPIKQEEAVEQTHLRTDQVHRGHWPGAGGTAKDGLGRREGKDVCFQLHQGKDELKQLSKGKTEISDYKI